MVECSTTANFPGLLKSHWKVMKLPKEILKSESWWCFKLSNFLQAMKLPGPIELRCRKNDCQQPCNDMDQPWVLNVSDSRMELPRPSQSRVLKALASWGFSKLPLFLWELQNGSFFERDQRCQAKLVTTHQQKIPAPDKPVVRHQILTTWKSKACLAWGQAAHWTAA